MSNKAANDAIAGLSHAIKEAKSALDTLEAALGEVERESGKLNAFELRGRAEHPSFKR